MAETARHKKAVTGRAAYILRSAESNRKGWKRVRDGKRRNTEQVIDSLTKAQKTSS